MKTKLFLEPVLDVLLLCLLGYSICSWLFSPAHQISQELKQTLAVVVLAWISYRIFIGENRDDDWAGQF